ncbi:hypothetical protein ACTQ3O_13175, partial [Mediterraneibacter faecis]|uniref:hypothetical protein n=1 Tax=Mediterraneibacter faecis TaxID=592978 RepID=UPI003F9C9B5D
WASSDDQAPEILRISGTGCIGSDIFEINVSTNIDNIKNWLPIKSGSQKKMLPEEKQKRNIMTGIPFKEHFDLFSFG